MINIYRSPVLSAVTFTDADTKISFTSTEISNVSKYNIKGTLYVRASNPSGVSKTYALPYYLRPTGQGDLFGIDLYESVRHLCRPVDISQVESPFSDTTAILIESISITVVDAVSTEIDSAHIDLNIILQQDTAHHDYTALYKDKRFAMLSQYADKAVNGYFCISYITSSIDTTVYITSDGVRTKIADFKYAFIPGQVTRPHICVVTGSFDSDSALIEIIDFETVVATQTIFYEPRINYDTNLLYIPNSLGVPELFVCTGRRDDIASQSSDFVDLRDSVILSNATHQKSIQINTGYLSTEEMKLLSSLLPVRYNCFLDGLCYLDANEITRRHGIKNNVQLSLRIK